ncbi:hypothetical protein N9L33_03590 [Nitrospinae bacterium]|nr:hypothetical protein [Nitrospinota bacterium]
MSTIQSSAEHLTLNADGSSKDIKFQANGVEKASISSSGAFTSTTIDATKLTGNLPAISGAALTGVGVAGISSSADATAMTINATENVGIGVVPETWSIASALQIGADTCLYNDSGYSILSNNAYFNSSNKYINSGAANRFVLNDDGSMDFDTAPSGSADAAITFTERLKITNDGRGLSEFTARVWVNFNGTGTVAIRDSHNVSSITDNGTGDYNVNFTNNLANSDYCAGAFNAVASSEKVGVNGEGVGTFRIRTGYGYYANFTYADRSLVKAVAFGGF